ncbi:MAG: NAD-dependent epimerase/dehydratase family protein [Rhodospirillales bacterium]|nr:NAD-dependent epimerase/dehydratase family protein [Rhodospirillales bacterium]
MAAERILITGGAGFIGCHLTKALLDRGHTVRVLDSLIDQVHGGREPNPILQHVELVEGDIRDPAAVASALQGVDAQGRPLVPVPTTEAKRPSLASVYAITKFVQERMVLTVAPAYGMEAAALRLFNVYGPGQALSNPYTGVLAIFAAMLLNGNGPQVFEDGAQRRDFVHVEDVARAFVLALERPEAVGQVFNIGSGQAVTIRQVAEELATAMGRRDIRPVLLGKARTGDIRHCFADIGAAQATLGFAPERNFGNSLAELAEWVRGQQTVDRVAEARRELEVRGLVA